MLYVCLDKITKEPKGITSVREENLSDWEKDFIMIEADESYRGKQGYEIKYENGKLRFATQQEIEDVLAQRKQEQEQIVQTRKKQEFLELLDDVDIKNKISIIQIVPSGQIPPSGQKI